MAMHTFRDQAEKSAVRLGDVHADKIRVLAGETVELRKALPLSLIHIYSFIPTMAVNNKYNGWISNGNYVTAITSIPSLVSRNFTWEKRCV